MKDNEFDFDTEFTSDDEIEKMTDDIVTAIAKQAAKEDSLTAIVNPHKVRQVIHTYKVLQQLTRGTKAAVTYELYEPYKSMGAVSVIGSNLSFRNAEGFVNIAKFASNIEIYPKTDGTVQINFTFHGLTTSIE